MFYDVVLDKNSILYQLIEHKKYEQLGHEYERNNTYFWKVIKTITSKPFLSFFSSLGVGGKFLNALRWLNNLILMRDLIVKLE